MNEMNGPAILWVAIYLFGATVYAVTYGGVILFNHTVGGAARHRILAYLSIVALWPVAMPVSLVLISIYVLRDMLMEGARRTGCGHQPTGGGPIPTGTKMPTSRASAGQRSGE